MEPRRSSPAAVVSSSDHVSVIIVSPHSFLAKKESWPHRISSNTARVVLPRAGDESFCPSSHFLGTCTMPDTGLPLGEMRVAHSQAREGADMLTNTVIQCSECIQRIRCREEEP